MVNLFETLFDLNEGYINVTKIKKLSSTKFIEIFDADKLKIIADNKDEFMKLINRKNAQDKVPFMDYLKNSNNGKINVEYYQNKDLYTRYQPKSSLSGGVMLREARYTIFDKYYIDIDLCNCHPNIILWICDNMNIETRYLNKYVNNREEVFDDLINLNPDMSRCDVKVTLLKSIYGGSLKNIKVQNEFLIGFNEELKRISPLICSQLHKFLDIVTKMNTTRGKEWNNIGSCMSHICQFVENQLLMIILNKLKRDMFKDKDWKNCILCFDGIMIPKEYEVNIDYHIRKIEESFKKMGCGDRFKLSQKRMEPIDLSLMTISNKQIPNDKFEKVYTNYFDFDDDYYWTDFLNELGHIVFDNKDDMCKYLGKHLNRVCVIVDNNVIVKSDKKSKYRIESLGKWGNNNVAHFMKADEKKSASLASIIKYNGSYFHIFNTVSSNFEHPRNNKEFDLSLPFVARECEIKEDILKLFKDFVLEVICDNDISLFEYLWKWLAFICKYPSMKSKVALLLVSNQGTGKGFFIDFIMEYILGSNICLPNIKLEDVTSDKNAQLMGKKMILINEVNSRKETYCSNSNKLKSFITEDNIYIRPLYSNGFNTTQSTEIVVCTNFSNSIMIEKTDRRWLVCNVSEKYMNNREYFGHMRKKLYNQEAGNIVYTDLINQDLKSYEFLMLLIPMTRKKEEMKQLSKNSVECFIDEKIEEDPSMKYKTVEFYAMYDTWCTMNKEVVFKKRLFKECAINYKLTTIKSHGDIYYIVKN